MKYAAFLRGINVGGKTLIKMNELVSVIGNAGFTNVSTYIASGNVMFESREKDVSAIENIIEDAIERHFRLPVRVVVLSHDALRRALEDVPAPWKTGKDLRRYIAFVKPPVTAADVMKAMRPKEGVDFIYPGKGVVYMGTRMNGLTKSGINKIIGTPVYRSMTMRNYTTAVKVLERMDLS